MPRYAYVNGEYVRHGDAVVHIEDRAVQFADSVYEVVSFIRGQFADEKGHLDRLERSLAELDIPMPVSRESLRFIFRHILRLNRFHQNGVIYLQISRGVAKRDFRFPAAGTAPSLIVYAWDYDFKLKPENLNGIRVVTLPDQRWARRDIKTTQLLGQSLAKQTAINSGVQDAWMVDPDGFVTEASSSNAWILKGKTLYTRRANSNILKGVTRTAVSNLVEKQGLDWEEKAFTPAEAQDADEAFDTSATGLVMPVIEIDGQKIGDGKVGRVTKALLQEYVDYIGTGEPISWTA